MDIPEHIRSARHNCDRTAWRRQRRWERRVPARFLDDLEDPPPGGCGVPWSKAREPEDDDPELRAVLEEFEEKHRDLLERFRRTPTCEKRRRRVLRKELAHHLKCAGLISSEVCKEICGEGDASRRMASTQRHRRNVATVSFCNQPVPQGGLLQ